MRSFGLCSFGLFLALSACGSDQLALGKTRGQGIFNEGDVSRYSTAIFDSHDHGNGRRSFYAVISPDPDICKKLQQGTAIDGGMLLVGRNDEQKRSTSSDGFELIKRQLVTGRPNHGGGIIHFSTVNPQEATADWTVGWLSSEEVSKTAFSGEVHLSSSSYDESSIAFNARRCDGVGSVIHAILKRGARESVIAPEPTSDPQRE